MCFLMSVSINKEVEIRKRSEFDESRKVSVVLIITVTVDLVESSYAVKNVRRVRSS